MKKTNIRIDDLILVLVLVLTLPLSAISSADPNINGDDQSTLPETAHSSQPTPSETRSELALLEQALNKLESEYDAYDPAIAEVSLDIAERLSDRGNLEDANVAYRRALHVTRINEGLDSERQIPILERMVSLHSKLGEGEDASSHLNRLTTLYVKNYGEMSTELLTHLHKLGNWHLSNSYFGPRSTELHHLMAAHSAYERILQIRQAENLGYDQRLYSHLSIVNYAMVQYLQALQINSSGLSDTSLRYQSQINFALSSYHRGKRQLEQGLLEAQKSLGPEKEITALLQLADWEQLFGKKFTARDRYIEAYTKTLELPPEHEFSGMFERPQKLPVNDIPSLIPNSPKRDTIAVHLTMDINHWGVSRNIKLSPLDNSDGSTRTRRTAMSIAYDTIYRPAIVEGSPVSSEGVSQTLILVTSG